MKAVLLYVPGNPVDTALEFGQACLVQRERRIVKVFSRCRKPVIPCGCIAVERRLSYEIRS